jgi:glyceraldehyde 3-phosphate dehydrogenase
MPQKVRVGINGFGRIGRIVFRALASRKDEFEVVGINNVPFDLQSMSYLLRYDTTYGAYAGTVATEGDKLVVDGRAIPCFGEKEPQKLPWRKLGAEIVLESTGVFRKREQCAWHLEAGASRMLLSAPAKDDVDLTVVVGVNDDKLTRDHRIISNASCTTNCLATIARVLHDRFGIAQGLMTTVHAMTNDQSLLDFVHAKDLRRGRAAPYNIVPTSTGAATAVSMVIPALEGRLDGTALRVPVVVGSIVDLAVSFERPPASVGDLHAVIKAAAEGPMRGIIRYTEDEIVSSDIIGDPHSAIFDASMTTHMPPNFWKVFAWYDNEWGFSQRCADLMKKLRALDA